MSFRPDSIADSSASSAIAPVTTVVYLTTIVVRSAGARACHRTWPDLERGPGLAHEPAWAGAAHARDRAPGSGGRPAGPTRARKAPQRRPRPAPPRRQFGPLAGGRGRT